MRLEKKDILLVIPATLLTIAGLGPDDPWVIGPCLVLSWLSFIAICFLHEGSAKWRAVIAIVITAALSALAYRRFGLIYHEPSPHPLDFFRDILGRFVRWLEGPHGRWFYTMLGAAYAILALVILLVIAVAVKLVKRQTTREGKGFLDYKFDAETAMQKMPLILEKLTRIMNEVGPAMSKHTAALLRAKSTAGQLRVSRAAALSLDRYSMRVDSIGKQFVENGRLLSEGLLGWSTLIRASHPNKAVFGTFPDVLKHLTGTIGVANDSLTGYVASTISIKGVSSVLNAAVDRHVASWTVILQANKRTFEACTSTLAVLDGLS